MLINVACPFHLIGGHVVCANLSEISRRYWAGAYDEIAEAVRNSSSDILVIVRGGGAETDFQPFNDKKVLEALSQNSSYRIVGIGHSNDTTLVDVIADYSASVPADAGVHIRDQLGNIRSLVVQFEQSLTQQEGELVRARTEIARLNESIQSNKKLVVAKQDKRRLWAIIIAIVLAGLYFSWQNPGVLTEILNVVPFSKGTG